MIAYIKSVLDSDSNVFYGQCLYYLESESHGILGSHFCSDRIFAEQDLIKDYADEIKNLNITKIMSDGKSIFEVNTATELEGPKDEITFEVSEHILKSIKSTLDTLSKIHKSNQLTTCIDRDIMTNILRLEKILDNKEITGYERLELVKRFQSNSK